jgi:hypothetical protein
VPGGRRRSCGSRPAVTTLPTSHTTGFFDITEGANFTSNTVCGYLCTAMPGYDGPTGVGTPNGTSGF